MTLQDN